MKFRKKPEEVEAVQFTGKHSLVDIIDALDAHNQNWYYSEISETLRIEHGEIGAIANKGDWIIRKGNHFYPCGKVAFELMYEPAICSKEMPEEPSTVTPIATSELYCDGCGKPKVLCLGGTTGCNGGK